MNIYSHVLKCIEGNMTGRTGEGDGGKGMDIQIINMAYAHKGKIRELACPVH
jgi:hypothetical protein